MPPELEWHIVVARRSPGLKQARNHVTARIRGEIKEVLGRRLFLKLCSSNCALALLPRAPDLPGSPQAPATDSLADLMYDVLGDVRGARAIGLCYLRAYPTDLRGIRSLLDRLKQCACRADVSRMLGQMREWDFEQGDVVLLDGWILARTEARTCATALFL